MTGWALVGTGRQVQNEVAPAVAKVDGTRIVAVVGTSMAKAEKVSDQFPGAYGTTDLSQALADPDVDLVYIGSPNGLHHEHVAAALDAGKHVLCDKPLAVDSRQAAGLVSMAERAGRRLGVVHQLRHHPAHLAARSMLRDGVIGDLLSIRVDYGSPSQLAGWRTDPTRAGGGVVFNVGIHLVDLVRFLSDDEVAGVAASTQTDPSSGLDVSVSGLLTLTSSATASVWCSHRATAASRALTLNGTDGSIVVSDSLQLTGSPVASALTVTTSTGEVTQETFAPAAIMWAQAAAFHGAVTSGSDPDPGPTDGLAGVLVTEALLAASSGTSVAVPDPRSVRS